MSARRKVSSRFFSCACSAASMRWSGAATTAAHQWFNAENVHLGEVPAAMSQRAQGLVRVVEYLDAMRGR